MKKECKMNQRKVVKAIMCVLAVVIMGVPISSRTVMAAERIVVRDPGGEWSQAAKIAYYDAFRKETGIEVLGISSPTEPISQIKSIVDTKSYVWDVSDLSMSAVGILGPAGYLEEIDMNAPDIRDFIPEAKSKWVVAVQVYAIVIAYNKEKYGSRGPANWADFFDVKKFPGTRSFRKNPIETFEAALLADGVPKEKLYPLDIPRAFAKLDKIKPHIAVWWSSGAQSAQLAKTREVDLIHAYNGRIQGAIDDGAPFQIVWNEAIWSPDGFAIPRGNPKVEICQKFVKFCARPDRQAEFAMHIPYGAPNPNAFKFLPPERIKLMPLAPQYVDKIVYQQADYWVKNYETVMEKFNTWVTK
jgi:putative spermidine/putrescine transport system substrate-binding protein